MSEDNKNLPIKAKSNIIPKGQDPLTFIANNPEQGLEFLKIIAEGANTGVTTTGDALMLLSTAKEFGIGLSAAMRNINVIRGKVTLSYHLMKAALIKFSNEIDYERTRDYEEVYAMIASDGVTVRSDKLPDYAQIVPLKDLNKPAKEGKVNYSYLPAMEGTKKIGEKKVIDIITEYEFNRLVPDIKNPGKMKVKTIRSSYSRLEAVQADMYKSGEKGSGPWVTREKVMIDKTAFVLGAREIAPDLFLGMYAPFELDPMVEDNMDVGHD